MGTGIAMLKAFSIGLACAAVLASGAASAKDSCTAADFAKMVEQCGGYVVWINRGKSDCSYGFRGERLFCATKSGYLACEQEAQRLRCRRPLSNQ